MQIINNVRVENYGKLKKKKQQIKFKLQVKPQNNEQILLQWFPSEKKTEKKNPRGRFSVRFGIILTTEFIHD